ncbi:MAG: hypothetical protein JWN10_668 [Solirubrobacterales bacterium]|nr:hypothetical protein [Solirubrobacterales bacterium]
MFLAPRPRTTPRSVPLEPLRCGTYLTDGRRLFRVVSQFAPAGGDAFAALEDCGTLDVQAYAPGELQAMKLRPIRR